MNWPFCEVHQKDAELRPAPCGDVVLTKESKFCGSAVLGNGDGIVKAYGILSCSTRATWTSTREIRQGEVNLEGNFPFVLDLHVSVDSTAGSNRTLVKVFAEGLRDENLGSICHKGYTPSLVVRQCGIAQLWSWPDGTDDAKNSRTAQNFRVVVKKHMRDVVTSLRGNWSCFCARGRGNKFIVKRVEGSHIKFASTDDLEADKRSDGGETKAGIPEEEMQSRTRGGFVYRMYKQAPIRGKGSSPIVYLMFSRKITA
ncbi:hypothetical protein BDN72DRAFT_949487 [Pluteus cervinus]|uniref:Uncharacterized protein n=1 Tax=Pluteus cervinus TaxID=181527 RepID=A0ACD3ASN5_9AGAR|nr:hypothetical protein BDN72DRAFT_949487 [Pluteus cervinus]